MQLLGIPNLITLMKNYIRSLPSYFLIETSFFSFLFIYFFRKKAYVKMYMKM